MTIAGISLPNAASVALHRKFGFTDDGVFEEYASRTASTSVRSGCSAASAATAARNGRQPPPAFGFSIARNALGASFYPWAAQCPYVSPDAACELKVSSRMIQA